MTKKKQHSSTTQTAVSTKEYVRTLSDLKKQIKQAQIKVSLAANKELIKLYWAIGKTIVEKQKEYSWGSNVIEQLSKDLQNAFPGVKGFSKRNLFRMKAFFVAYEKVPQAVAQIDEMPVFRIPWGHNAVILEKVKNQE